MKNVRITILGCSVDNLTMQESLERVGELIESGLPNQHVVINADKVVKANTDPVLKEIINNCAMINADGMPVVWASKLLGEPLKERVAGVDLFVELMRYSAEKSWRVYFLGAKEEVVSHVVDKFSLQYPNLQIAGYRNGYWSDAEEQSVVDAITASKANLLFVAISSPRKEQFLAKYQSVMKVPFAMGVGGTFDVMAGKTKRAPLWMQKTGFEWFYRFLQEPRRMFKRYFVEDMYFFVLLAKEMLNLKSKGKL